jgi:phosphate uptake regulator
MAKAKPLTDFIRKLMSFEIIEQTSSRIVVRDFLNLKDISIHDIVRRMDIITRAMMEDAVLCTKQDLCSNIDYRDLDVNRFYYLIFRVIKGGMKDPNIARTLKITQGELLDYYRLISSMEDIADGVKRVARSFAKLKLSPKKKKELCDLFKSVQKSYLEAMKSYYTRDRELADQHSELGKELMLKCNKFLEDKSCAEVPSIVEKLKVIVKNVRNIARVTLDLE